MKKEDDIKDWSRIHKNLTDPDIKAENKRKALKKQRIEQKRSDTGL